VYLSQSGDRLTVRNCTLFGNQRAGLQINAVEGTSGGSNPSTDSISEECLVENNTIHGNGAAGGSAIQLMSVRRSVIQNNLVYGNLAGGMSLWDDGAGANYGCKQNKLLHNTVTFQTGRGRYGVQVSAGSTGNELLNNILVCGSGPALEADEPVRSDYNFLSAPSAVNNGTLAAWQRSTGNDLHSQEGNPGLTGDYHPASGSRVIDGALQVIPTDKDGALRPQGPNPDVGCYEAGSSGGGGTPPPPGPSGSFVLYGDAVAPGWTLARWRSTVSSVSNPVSEGSRSMAFTVKGADGYLTLTGPGVATSGRTHLKLMVHGGKRGGQELRLRAFLDGQPQSFTLNLRNYGGLPPRGAWIQYSVPLADLQAQGRALTGARLFAGRKQPRVYVDSVRVE
jgi:hypothetical protein